VQGIVFYGSVALLLVDLGRIIMAVIGSAPLNAKMNMRMKMKTSKSSRAVHVHAAGPSKNASLSRPSSLSSSTTTSSTRRLMLLSGAASLLFLNKNNRNDSDNYALAEEGSLVADLLAKSKANKAINDKHRQRTFDANLARSRTVTDQTCKFPNNFFGCENYAEVADVKFLSDDIKGECASTEEGKLCRSKVKNSFPSFLGL